MKAHKEPFLFLNSNNQQTKINQNKLSQDIVKFLNVNIDNIKMVDIKNKKIFFDVFQNKILVFVNIKINKIENSTEKKIEIQKKLLHFLSKKYLNINFIIAVVFCGFY